MTLKAAEQTCKSHWLSLASPSRRCLENTPDSDPQLALIHPKHAMPSRSPISITWKSVPLLHTSRYVIPRDSVLRTLGREGLGTRLQAYRVVLDRTSTDSHSPHTVVNVKVCCLSLWLLKLGYRYSCSHARVSKRPPADLAIHHNTLRAAKEQPDVTSYIPCILSLACNWSIACPDCGNTTHPG